MARLRPWGCQWPEGSRILIQQFPLKSGSTFDYGAFVFLDSNEDIDECGADPAAIMGISMEPAASVLEPGKILVAVATGNAVFAMQGDNAPTEDDLYLDCGIAKDLDGRWYVDGTDTTNDRVKIVGIDTNRALYFVKVLSAVRQWAD